MSFHVGSAAVAYGFTEGLTYGLLAVGIVLVHRASRIINFAHAQTGAFAAAVLALLVHDDGVPYWVAFPLAVLVGAGTGVLAEIVIVRRLRGAPAVMSVVATLGFGQFLLLFATVVDKQLTTGADFPKPAWFGSIDVAGAFRLGPAYLAMLTLAPVVIAALTVFLRRSTFGLCIRAAAANPEAARLTGVSAAQMSAVAWGLAGALSAFTAILVIPTQAFGAAAQFGPSLLLTGLTAAVIGRLTSLPIACLAGIGIGVVQAVVDDNDVSHGLSQLVLLAIVALSVGVQARQGTRERERGSWTAVQSWASIPQQLQAVWVIRHRRGLAALAAAGVALLVPLIGSNADAYQWGQIVSFALVGISVGLVTGLGGQLSLGQFAIAGVGAAVSFQVTDHTGNYLLAWVCAGGVGALLAIGLGMPALRVRGFMFAVITLAFALTTYGWLLPKGFLLKSSTGITPGRPLFDGRSTASEHAYYFVVVGVSAAVVWIVSNLRAGGFGRVAVALRDNTDQARAFSVPVRLRSLQLFALSGFVAGVGGSLYGHAQPTLSPSNFTADASIKVVTLAIIGGLGVLAGPFFGALFVIGIPAFIPLQSAGLAATQLGLLVLLLYAPSGIAGLLGTLRARALAAIARRAGIVLDDDGAAAPPPPLAEIAPLERHLDHRSGQTVLEVVNVSKRFGGVRAVDNVSLTVTEGETVGLIGPNGAGKTTVFEIVGGFTSPDQGRVLLHGWDVTRHTPEQRAHAGMVRSFQDAPLFSTLTVRETVQVAFERTAPTRLIDSAIGSRLGEKDKERKARALVSLMGLSRYADVTVSALSTGTRRITELACLIALEPSVLLLDEPASGVAQRETEALAGLLQRLKSHLGVTLVIIEHDIPLLRVLSDRIVAMETGRVIAAGSPVDVLADPAVVESYLGGSVVAVERSSVAIG